MVYNFQRYSYGIQYAAWNEPTTSAGHSILFGQRTCGLFLSSFLSHLFSLLCCLCPTTRARSFSLCRQVSLIIFWGTVNLHKVFGDYLHLRSGNWFSFWYLVLIPSSTDWYRISNTGPFDWIPALLINDIRLTCKYFHFVHCGELS
jgi:hypothetical protein